MKHNASEFVNFLASHFRPIEAMCRERVRFSRDDEIAVFLHRFEDDDKNVTKLIGRMREVGVLRELAGLWSPPPFVMKFLESLAARNALASPQVVQGWIESLRDWVTQFADLLNNLPLTPDADLTETLQFLMQQVAEIFQTIQQTVEENCERIAAEVAEYRSLEDAHHLRARLSRLVSIQSDFLDPVIRILDVNGELHDLTKQISSCCIRLEARLAHASGPIAEEAAMLRREIVWLHRVTVRRAEEARRELGPLCEAAARESKISVGVNRALERIASRDWLWLRLEATLAVLDEHDGTLFSELAIENYLDDVTHAIPAEPPMIPEDPPTRFPTPPTASDLLGRLGKIGQTDDLMQWILDAEPKLPIGGVLRLFDEMTKSTDRVKPSEEAVQYQREGIELLVPRWTFNAHTEAK